ncbi:MAG: hypothetical protein EOO61_14930 [Hymenobacter sp.]|nr:MAG: hypothetical protein EOO61_14930 [Hymenobacter sp.]
MDKVFTGVALATAHPAKFKPLVEEVIGQPIDVPERLAVMANKPKQSIQIGKEYESFREALLQTV